MEDNKLTIIDHKNQTIVVDERDLLEAIVLNFQYDIEVWNVQGTVDGWTFELEHYDSDIVDLRENMHDALVEALNDLYSNDKFNPKAKQ